MDRLKVSGLPSSVSHVSDNMLLLVSNLLIGLIACTLYFGFV